MTESFNPLDMENLAHSIVTRIMGTDPTGLAAVNSFHGAGLYAIYYCGSFPAYDQLANLNSAEQLPTHPIYVGKAVPAGGRRGLETSTGGRTTTLFRRLKQHAASVESSTNLDIHAFSVRWLAVQDIWIPLGESALIRRYRPVWNALVDGFGNHDPGAGRHAGMRSRWDTLHPGRPWAMNFVPRVETAAEIEQEVYEYLRSRL